MGTVTATDPEAATLTYSIEGGSSAGLFEIDPSTGALSYKGAGEDYESGTTNYELTVRASDGSLHADVTVTVNITDVEELVTPPPTVDYRDSATDLGDITDLAGPRFPNASLDGDGDQIDYFRFTLTEAKEVGLGLRQQDADADLFLEDAEGNVLYSSTEDGTANEWISQTLLAGTYYVRMEAQEAGDNDFRLRYGVSAPDADEVARLEQQQQGATNEAPTFGQQSYAFDLVENADGGTNRVALGTVTATDPEAAALTYSIEGGNEAGLFEIDGSTGALSYKGTGEDYESGTTSYELRVRASDGGLHSDVTVTVNVTDVDEQTEPDPLNSQDRQAAVQETVSEPDGEDFSADISSQGRVTVGGTATGKIGSSGDRDWFAVDLVAGHTYVIDLRGRPTGDGTLSDPYLRGIHDADGNLISGTTNDDGGEGRNSRLTFTASESGTYFIAAGAYSSRQGTYELEVTDTAAADDLPEDTSTTGRVAVGGSATGEIGHADDRDWFAVELEVGKTYQIDTSGAPTKGGTLPRGSLHGVYDAEGNSIPGVYDRATSWIRVDGQDVRQDDDQVFFTPDEDGTYYIAASNGGTTGTGTYTVRITEMEDDFPTTVDTTGTVEVGGSATGEIEYQSDRDWFAVELVAGRSYTIDLRGRPTNDGTLSNPKLSGIHDAEGNRIPDTHDFDGGAGRNSRSHFTATESGTYYIAAGSQNLGVGTYEVEVWEDDFAASRETTGTVEVGGSTTGEIQRAEDRDYFAVELEAGKTYQIDLSGELSGVGTLPRPHLHAVFNADGNNMGVSDPVLIGGLTLNGILVTRGEDSQAFFTPDADGTYYLVVSNFGSGTGTYSVGVTEIEDDYSETVNTTGTVEVGGTATGELQYETDRDWFAVELTAGETYKINLFGRRLNSDDQNLHDPYIRGVHDSDGRLISGTTDYASGPYSNSEVLFTPDEDGTYYVAAGSYLSGYREEDVGTYTLQVSVDDFSDDTDTTGTVEVGGSVTGEIEAQGDRDWFAVTLEAGKTYQIDMQGSATDVGTLANPLLSYMRDANGEYLRDANGWRMHSTADQDSGEGLNSRVTFTPDEDATYYVVAASGGHLQAADSHGRSLGTYTLSVEEVVDAI